MAKPKKPDKGRYSYDGLDRVIHEKARLGILTCLLTRPRGLGFGELKDLCTLTDGNLSRHLAILQEAALVAMEKSVKGNRPHSQIRITELGRSRFLEYLDELEHIIHDAIPGPATEKGFQKSWSPA